LKLNGTCNILVCVDNVDLLGENINSINEIAEALLDPSKEGCLEADTEKAK
jgi:hypothetical protein